MPVRSLWSLIGDRVAARAFAKIRERASVHSLFSGIVVPVDDLIGRQIMATGSFEATQIDGIAKLFDDEHFADRARSGAFVDVGSNIGLYAIAFAKHFRQCIAIEANPQTFKVLQANMVLRDQGNVMPLCVGASDRAADTVIHVPINGNLGWARLGTSYHESKAIAISVRTLDDILGDAEHPPVTMIKIDVEGHEPNVLEGARQTLTNDGPVVLFEVLDREEGRKCHAVLEACGYRHFYAFHRRWPRGSNPLERLARGVRTGIPVVMEAVALEDLRRATLVCASKEPSRAALLSG